MTALFEPAGQFVENGQTVDNVAATRRRSHTARQHIRRMRPLAAKQRNNFDDMTRMFESAAMNRALKRQESSARFFIKRPMRRIWDGKNRQ